MASLDEVFPPPAVARHKAPKRPAPADAPPAAPWHGGFAGNATDGLLDDWTDMAEERAWFLKATLG